MRVFTFSNVDEKIFVYNFSEEETQEAAELFTDDIFFTLEDDEVGLLHTADARDNLKEDFIWFRPGINQLSIIQCTCGDFLESDQPTEAGHGRLAKKGLRHARKSGHTINLRGN